MSRPEERNGTGDAEAQPTRRDRNTHPPTGDPHGVVPQEVDAAPKFGRFELLLEIARGGMATLFLSRLRGPEGFEKLVALKRIREQLASEAQFTEMFWDKARIVAPRSSPRRSRSASPSTRPTRIT